MPVMKIPAMSSRTLTLLGAGAALASVVSFVAGLALFAVAVSLPGGGPAAPVAMPPADSGATAAAEQTRTAPTNGGFFGKLKSAATGALSRMSGDGPARPRFDGSRPIGLYLMTKYWIATGSLEKSVWYFAPDGRVFLNPDGGFSEPELSAQSQAKGNITMNGDVMTITWSDGRTSSNDVERSDGSDGFAWDTGLYAPVKPFGDSAQLVGKWEGGESISFSGNSAITSRSLDIRADGTFQRTGVASLRSESSESIASAGASAESSGTWVLDGYTLTLTFGDGKVMRGVAFPFDDEATPLYPDRFYFSGTMYKNQAGG